MRFNNQRLVLIIAVAIGISILVVACSNSRPALNWTFWKNLKVSQRSAAEHLAIADSYRRSAQDYRRIAKEHERMKTEYAEYASDVAGVMQAHCDSLVKKFNDLAVEMEAMAKEHDQLARLANRPLYRPLIEF